MSVYVCLSVCLWCPNQWLETLESVQMSCVLDLQRTRFCWFWHILTFNSWLRALHKAFALLAEFNTTIYNTSEMSESVCHCSRSTVWLGFSIPGWVETVKWHDIHDFPMLHIWIQLYRWKLRACPNSSIMEQLRLIVSAFAINNQQQLGMLHTHHSEMDLMGKKVLKICASWTNNFQRFD